MFGWLWTVRQARDLADAAAWGLSVRAGMRTGTGLTLDGGASAIQAGALLRPGPRAALGLPPLDG
ncbi:hypothetical protein ACFSKW_38290 [Nonomuraea mangrovi]|uniref:Uncharacterized protein n=1 Tax=Nonomuraea mangrovi TaxID=2316207 RepID=A0ABW4T6C3_9ACTN